MSYEYTPTTDDVRRHYSNWVEEYGGDKTGPDEFDRWLAEVKATVWEEGFHAGRGFDISNPYVYG